MDLKQENSVTIGVVGTGAIGGYYGALLARSGFDVHFLLHSDFDHVNRYGLFVESKDRDINLTKVNAYNSADDMPSCDLVIVALKSTQNTHLKTILPRIVNTAGSVLILQNGLGVEEEISDLVPAATVIGGLCFICTSKVGPGHIRHLDYGSIRIGAYRRDGQPAGITKNLKIVSDILSKATIPVHMTDNLGRARWEKLVWNIPFNGLSVILNATTEQLIGNAASRELAYEIMLEVIQGARQSGYAIEDRFADQMVAATNRMVAYSPSMKLDFDAGRPLEIDRIYKFPIQAAKKAGFDMHRSKAICFQLEFLDRKHRESSIPINGQRKI